MQISAISVNNIPAYPQKKHKTSLVSPKAEHLFDTPMVINFKGGNKGQIFGLYPEIGPFWQAGGVATRAKDDASLRISETDRIFDKPYTESAEFLNQPNKVAAFPMYNCQRVYNTKNGLQVGIKVPEIPYTLPTNSPFKKFEGKLFFTNNANFQKYLDPEEFFAKEPKLALNKNIFIVEDVTGNADTTLDFGTLEPTEKRLYRYMHYDKATDSLKPTHYFPIFADQTASMSAPYKGGGYSTSPSKLRDTWKGDPYDQWRRAAYEFLESGRFNEIKKADGINYDPATIVINDCHTANFIEDLAKDYVAGKEFAKGKKCVLELHNGADGYTQRTSYQNMFINLADKKMRANVMNDPELAEALKRGGDEVNKYFAKLIPEEIKDAQGSVSPYVNTIYYAEKGYVPRIATVSEPYADILANNENFAPGTYERVKALYKKGIFTGYVNPLGDDMDPYKIPDMYGYKQDLELGEGIKTKAFTAFDKTKVNKENIDINHIREIKRLNKINLFERLQKDTLTKLKKLKEVEGHERDYNVAITGKAANNVEVYGYIDEKYLNEVKKPNGDIKLIVSWGRMDTQKGLDTVLESFEKYVTEHEKNADSVLILGGPMTKGEQETDKMLKIMDRVTKNNKLKGRVALLGGFAPNKPLAMAADFAMFPSRFAPCELTDLESTKVFCTPIVTNCQGLAQKNFDETFEGEAEKVTGYKARHEYELEYDELKELLSGEDLEELERSNRKFKSEIAEPYRISHGGKILSDEEIMKKINESTELNYNYRYKLGVNGLREHRDKVIVNELAGCLKRALIDDRNKEIQTKMAKNQINLDTSWEGNGALSRTGKSSAELFREGLFKPDAQDINEEDTIVAKIRATKGYQDVLKRLRERNKIIRRSRIGGKIKDWSHSTKGKWLFGSICGAAVLSAIGYAGYKIGWLNPAFADKKEVGRLSKIG